MMQYYTEAARQQEDYSDVKQIGVDETSKAKGHDYVSLFVDLAKKRTIYVGESSRHGEDESLDCNKILNQTNKEKGMCKITKV